MIELQSIPSGVVAVLKLDCNKVRWNWLQERLILLPLLTHSFSLAVI